MNNEMPTISQLDQTTTRAAEIAEYRARVQLNIEKAERALGVGGRSVYRPESWGAQRRRVVEVTTEEMDEIEAGTRGSLILRGEPIAGNHENFLLVVGGNIPVEANRTCSFHVGAILYIEYRDMLDLWPGLGYSCKAAMIVDLQLRHGRLGMNEVFTVIYLRWQEHFEDARAAA